MDVVTEKIVYSVTLHKAEADWISSRIETTALDQCLAYLINDAHLPVDMIVIDRNASCMKMLREKYPQVEIAHDWYHVAKSLKKAISTACRDLHAPALMLYQKDIMNSAFTIVSRANGDKASIRAGFVAIFNHLRNDHTGCNHTAEAMASFADRAVMADEEQQKHATDQK